MRIFTSLFDGAAWSLSTTLLAARQCANVTALVVGSQTAIVFCVATDGSAVYRFDDAPLQASTASTFASPASGTVFRGVALVP